MKHERKQLIHAQFIKQHNKVASLPSCYPAIISFKNMSLNSARDEALSQCSEGGRKFPSYPVTGIRPLHCKVTRHECC